MTIASFPFLGFALMVALAYNLARPLCWRQGVMAVANIAFLASFGVGELRLLPLLGFLVAGYLCLRAVRRNRSRPVFLVALGLVIVLFFWLKRYSFLPEASFLPFAYSVIGLSYMFFRVAHVMIDAYMGDMDMPVSPLGYLNYTLNFTSLVSGPIQRYQDYAADQLRPERGRLDWIDGGIACERIAIGLFKLVVVAAVLHEAHLRMLRAFDAAAGDGARILAVLATTIAYTFYLYHNFSGYCDIVIGSARFHRLKLPENFDRPFSATSFIEFWSRWHITLSEWLKTYVYNPLVMALMERFPATKAAPFLGVVAFFVTFFLIGLWHGQTSIFAVYGVLLGLGVSVNKLYQVQMGRRLGRKRYRTLCDRWWYKATARGLTFAWFNFSLVFFWGDWARIGGLANGLGFVDTLAGFVVLVAVASVVLAVWVAARDASLAVKSNGVSVLALRYTRTVFVTTAATLAVAALSLLAAPAPDVIYKVF